MVSYEIDEAYTVLADGETFSPAIGSKIIFATFDPAAPWEEIADATIYHEIDLGKYLLMRECGRMLSGPEIAVIVSCLRIWLAKYPDLLWIEDLCKYLLTGAR